MPAALLFVLFLQAAPPPGAQAAVAGHDRPPRIAPLPAGAVADYQLGGGYPPAAGVTVVVRDSLDRPQPGVYNVCYVNGFQTQPGEAWPHDLLVSNARGQPLADAGWPDEFLLNIAGDAQRQRIARRLEVTIRRCAQQGFNAVEFDNLDSWTRSQGALTAADALTFAGMLVSTAHRYGLAAGQKNSPELSPQGKALGFDFAVAEECHRYRECAAYTAVYGSQTIDIEYSGELRGSFSRVCADPHTPANTLLRDRLLSQPGHDHYRFAHCRLSAGLNAER